MIQECMRTTLTTVLEAKEKPREHKVDSKKSKTVLPASLPASQASLEVVKEVHPQPVTMYNPMMEGHPHLTISKFTGVNWTEFIKYFE